MAWSAIFLENRKYESLSQFSLGTFQRIRPALTNKRNIRSNIKIYILSYVENAHPSTPLTLFSIPTLQYIDRSPGSARSTGSFLQPERASPDVLGQKSGREEVRSSRRRPASPGKCCDSQKHEKDYMCLMVWYMAIKRWIEKIPLLYSSIRKEWSIQLSSGRDWRVFAFSPSF